MENARKLEYDQLVIPITETPTEIVIKNNVERCLLRPSVRPSNHGDHGIIDFSVTVPYNNERIIVSVDWDSSIPFVEEPPNIEHRLNSQEYGDTSPHSISMGGEEMIPKRIADLFYDDSNVTRVYTQVSGQDVFLLLVYTNDVAELDLRFARLQKHAASQYADRNIEIMYIPEDSFSDDFIPEGAVFQTRG